MKGLFSILLSLLFAVACTCLAADDNHRIATESLTALRPGISLAETEERLKTTLLHEFTTQIGTNAYRCMYLRCVNPPASFYILFQDSNLLRIVDTTPFIWTNKPWQRPLPVDPDARIAATMRQPALSAEEISQRLFKFAQMKANAGGSKSANVAPAFIMTAPLWLKFKSNSTAEMKQVEQWHTVYDPLRIELGSTPEEVKTKFGAPAGTICHLDGARIEVYGRNNPPNVPADTPPPMVGLVFKDDEVVTVLSHHFFSTDWHPLLP